MFLPADAELIARETRVPGLATVLDPEALAPVHYADAALHVAVGFFRRQERRWPETVAALVAQAGDALAGQVW